MVISNKLDLRLIFLQTWKRLLGLLILSSLLLTAHRLGYQEHLHVDTLPASVLGIALSIVLGFKINSSYARWLEARRLWGAITNDSRTLARQLLSFCPPDSQRCSSLIKRQTGFAYALKSALRKDAEKDELSMFISAKDILTLTGQQNIPVALLQLQGQEIAALVAEGILNSFQQIQLDTTLSRFSDAQGGCERIKNTGFSNSFTFHLKLFILIYSYLLPFVLISNSDWHTVPAAIFIGYVFLSLTTIAQNLEDPFENTWYDIPMNAICRTIEVNLSQQLGEIHPKSFLQPEGGFLH